MDEPKTDGFQAQDVDEPSAAGMASMLSGGGDDGLYVAEEKNGRVTGPALTAGLLVAAAAGGLWYLHQRAGGPAEAAAEHVAAATAVDGFLAGRRASIEEMRAVIEDTDAIRRQFLDYPAAAQVPLEGLQTDPFEFDPPKEEQAKELDAAAAERLAAERRGAVTAALRAVEVQGVMSVGGRPTCTIAHRLYRAGDTIDAGGFAFTVVGIRSDLVVVEENGVRYGVAVKR